MIKVMHVITDTNIGGAGRMLLTLLRNSDKKKFFLSVVIPQNSLLKDELAKIGCPFFEMPYIAEKSLSLRSVSAFLKLFKQEKPDIVHTHASMSARIAAKLYARCKIVNTRHSVFDLPAYQKNFPYKNLNGFVNNFFSDRIIAVSPAAEQNIVEVGANPKKVRVVYNGVEPARKLSPEEKRAVRASYGLAEDDFVCAIIARLEKVKGHAYVIEACKALQASAPDVKVLIAGTGGEEADLKASAQNLRNCVFVGFVSEIEKIENIMDIQLNASYGTEATSLALLEGMSLGVPAVVSDFGGNPYVIEDGINGLVVPKQNAQAICDAILQIKNNPLLYRAMRDNCLHIFNKRFTAKAMAEGIEKIYTELGVQT